MTACILMSPAYSGGLNEYYYGDSIAVGYGGNSPGRRRVGASPSEVLGYIDQDLKDNPERFRGQTVNLSTGISNNPDDLSSVEKQIERLRRAGANVSVLGAARGRYDRQNASLSSIASRYGASFRGGFVAGRDGVHPASYSSYDTGSGGSSSSSSSRPSSSSSSSTSTPAQTRPVLSKKGGVEGEGVGSNFVARNWNDTEKNRYKAYGGK